MLKLSETDLQTIINFFMKTRSRTENEEIIRKFASEHTEAFLSTISDSKKSVRESVVVPATVVVIPATAMEIVADTWMNIQPDVQGVNRANVSEKTWQEARKSYEQYNPHVRGLSDNGVKKIVIEDILSAYFVQEFKKIDAVKFYRCISGVGLKDASEFIDTWWEDKKNKMYSTTNVSAAGAVSAVSSVFAAGTDSPAVVSVNAVKPAQEAIASLPVETIKKVMGKWIRNDAMGALELYREAKNIPGDTPVSRYYDDALREVTLYVLSIHSVERRRQRTSTFLSEHTGMRKEDINNYIDKIANESNIDCPVTPNSQVPYLSGPLNH